VLDTVFQQRELDVMAPVCQARSQLGDGFFGTAAG
jgi:hypothetical protein